MLLRDYAITPDVFDETSYPHPAACDAELRNLKDVLLNEGLVRDLRQGEWSRVFADDARPWHRRAKELLKKLVQQHRLVRFEAHLAGSPSDDVEWCREALGTHGVRPFTGGIIVTESVKAAFPSEALVARIDRLSGAQWWVTRASSVTLRRDMREYRIQLDPVLRCANSLMFIDPHLDPAKPKYADFVQLLEAAGSRSPAPLIEIHRACYEGSGPSRTFPMRDDPSYFERRFRNALEVRIRAAGLRVEVFVWDDFHDRYLISDLVGISLPNGFDTTTDPKSITRWTRLSRQDRDDVQREFDPASGRYNLRHRFGIP
ncbi:MAG: hypothetical protein KatS3mg082_2939 [Nitrospiraceae bacterium]|nr:MAG: hypothetical protein KatS3mg081_2464 [Gemmatimonadales bacterium]GIW56535.1 MAG: hypothetical protein KatS3mg082_2939 [Nitrospiraceae bacterium]